MTEPSNLAPPDYPDAHGLLTLIRSGAYHTGHPNYDAIDAAVTRIEQRLAILDIITTDELIDLIEDGLAYNADRIPNGNQIRTALRALNTDGTANENHP